MIETADMESALRDQATAISDVLRDAVTALGRAPDSLAGVPIYSAGSWAALVPIEVC